MKGRRFLIRLILSSPLSIFTFGQGHQGKPERERDPVCGLPVEKNRELSATYRGHTYYFCSNRDRDTFKTNPQKYVK
jgi:YHS domain-containing protein